MSERAQRARAFEVLITFAPGGVSVTADGTRFEFLPFNPDAITALGVLEEGKQPDSLAKYFHNPSSHHPSATGAAADMGNVLGWLLLGPPPAATPLAGALASGMGQVPHEVSHVRLVLDFENDSLIGKVRAEAYPWELMRWFGPVEEGLWLGRDARFALVRQRRSRNYTTYPPEVRTSLSSAYVNGVHSAPTPSSSDDMLRDVVASLETRFPTLDLRLMTSARATAAARVDAPEADVVTIAGHGVTNGDGSISFATLPLLPGDAPPKETTASMPAVAERIRRMTGHARLVVLVACGSSMDGKMGLTDTGDTLGDLLVRVGIPAVVSLLGNLAPTEGWSVVYFLHAALLHAEPLDVAVQRFRASLADYATTDAQHGTVDWFQPIVTVASLHALDVVFRLAETIDGAVPESLFIAEEGVMHEGVSQPKSWSERALEHERMAWQRLAPGR